MLIQYTDRESCTGGRRGWGEGCSKRERERERGEREWVKMWNEGMAQSGQKSHKRWARAGVREVTHARSVVKESLDSYRGVDGALYSARQAICSQCLTLLSAQHLQMLQRQQQSWSLIKRTVTSRGETTDLTCVFNFCCRAVVVPAPF